MALGGPSRKCRQLNGALVGDAAAEGRLLVDLREVELSVSTPLALLDPSLPPILPDPLPSSLEAAVDGSQPPLEDSLQDDRPLALEATIPGPTFDASTFYDADLAARFHPNLAAVSARLAGAPRRQGAQEYGMHPLSLARLEQRVAQCGQIACVPHATSHRARTLRPEFQQVLPRLDTHPIRPTILAVSEDVQLQHLADQLSQQEQTPVLTPTYKQLRSWSLQDGEGARGAACALWAQTSSPRAPLALFLCALHSLSGIHLKGAMSIRWTCWSSRRMGP